MDVMETETNIPTIMNSKYYIDEMLNMNEMDEDIGNSEVTEFYDKCNILITGGSGFIGKLLIEKILRTCPNMGKLYMMIRPKKGKTSEERFKEQFEDCLYDRLKSEQPDFASHVIMIEGNTGTEDLGLSSTNRELLIKNTHIVFHCAATVRFDESIRNVVEINVRGTKLMLLLAKEMKNLKAFVHVSTAFSHCPLKCIQEKYYKPAMEVDKVLNLVNILDDDLLKHMETKLIGAWPNTYSFSKALGEEVVRLYSRNLPVCIVRPSIVISTANEPVRGWTNNMYGATGVGAGLYICILRVVHNEGENVTDIIPADYVINNIIVAAWDISKMKKNENTEEIIAVPEEHVKSQQDEPPIYNCVSSCQNPVTWNKFLYLNRIHGVEVPSIKVLWYHMLYQTKSYWLYNIYIFFLHLVPAFIVDTLARLTGHKPILLKAYRKIHKFSEVVAYFGMREWKFTNDNVIKLWEKTNSVDKKKFDFNVKSLDWDMYTVYHIRGIRIYLVKDPITTLEEGRAKYKMLTKIHFTIVTILYVLISWIVWMAISGLYARLIV